MGNLLVQVWEIAEEEDARARTSASARHRADARRKAGEAVSFVVERDSDGVAVTNFGLWAANLRYRGCGCIHCRWSDVSAEARELLLSRITTWIEALALHHQVRN